MLHEILKRPIIPVIVIEDAQQAEPLAEALLRGGMDIIEITCRTHAAAEALKRIKKSFPEMLLGAGTVVTADQAKMCLDCGVDFALAPGLNPETVHFFQKNKTLFVPGIMTPSEIEQGLALGCSLLKFFPAGAAGGPKLLSSITAAYKALPVSFCPTGGVGIDNLSDWLSLSMVSNVGGSWLATPEQILQGEWQEITLQVEEALAIAAEHAASE